MKTICPIHRFSYNGNVCPFCEKERINSLAHRFVNTNPTVIKKNAEREISESDLKKLVEKFKK